MAFGRISKATGSIKSLNLTAKPTKYSDTIGGKNSNDFLQFKLSNRSSFSLDFTSLKSTARVQLLNKAGNQIKLSPSSVKLADKIETTLDAGTYYIRVQPGTSNQKTRYSLKLAANSGVQSALDSSQPLNTTQLFNNSASTSYTASRSDDGSKIDIMVVYTAQARQAEGGTEAINRVIQAAVDEANQGYINSGVIHRLRLVHTAEVNYAESGVASTDLARLQSTNDGSLDEVHAMRNAYGADVVSLFVSNLNVGGISYVMDAPTSNFEAYAFNVVQTTAAKTRLTLAHEVGHNLGLNHDPANAAGGSAYSYGRGYIASNGVGDIMSYAQNRINYYSNPGLTLNGQAFGNSGQNAVQALNDVRLIAANWRQSVV